VAWVAEPRTPRRVVPLLAGALLAAGLTGCSDGTGSYCSALGADQKLLAGLSRQSAQPGEAGSRALRGSLRVLGGLRDKAPDDIADDWRTLVDALQGLADAVDATGAAPGDFAGGTRPRGVTEGQYQSVVQAATELQSTRVQQAGTSIEQHALDVCKVDLGAGLGGIG
jgi:hypothetical protein